jgi:DNA-binding response OmpR family regulator
MTVRVSGTLISTTVRDFSLLDYLARHSSRVFTRDQLLDAVWSPGAFVTQRSVDVYVRRLREKIEADPDNPRYLKTVRGIGYRFDTPSETKFRKSPASRLGLPTLQFMTDATAFYQMNQLL